MNTKIERITSISENNGKVEYNGIPTYVDLPDLELGKFYELHIVAHNGRIAAATSLDGVYTAEVKVTNVHLSGDVKHATVKRAPKYTNSVILRVDATNLSRPGKYKITYKWVNPIMPTIMDSTKL